MTKTRNIKHKTTQELNDRLNSMQSEQENIEAYIVSYMTNGNVVNHFYGTPKDFMVMLYGLIENSAELKNAVVAIAELLKEE